MKKQAGSLCSEEMKRHYILIPLMILLASCEKVLDIGTLEYERHITVNALVCADSAMFVNITWSRFFLDNSPFVAVDNATVTLDVNGTEITSTVRDGANYWLNYNIVEGDTLTLHVDLPGMGTITGGTRVPHFPNITTPDFTLDTTQPITQGDISFTLTDPAAVKNYYQIYLLERDSGSRWNHFEEKWDTIDTVIHTYFTCLNSEITTPGVNLSEGFMNYFTGLLFSDTLIDGKETELTVSLIMLRDTAEHPLLREYTLVVESLSEDAFLYFRDVAAAHSVGQYFSEPAAIFSNLNGDALGIFAGLARREWVIEP